jgi:hypothetical protein
VCVESGAGLAPALQRVAEELTVSHPALADELTLVNAEMRAGVERGAALKNLAERTGLDDRLGRPLGRPRLARGPQRAHQQRNPCSLPHASDRNTPHVRQVSSRRATRRAA